MKTGITVTLLLLLVTGVQAADEQGQFSVRGAGLVNCEDFVQARQSGDQLYLVGIGWIDDYLTALNEYAADTYDITSFESTEMLVAMINRHCEIHPEDRLQKRLADLGYYRGRFTDVIARIPYWLLSVTRHRSI